MSRILASFHVKSAQQAPKPQTLSGEEAAEQTVKLLRQECRRPEAKSVPMDEALIRTLLSATRSVLMSQSPFLELESPLSVCGDLHGQYGDLQRLLNHVGAPGVEANYLFLGDYVDRGRNSVEVMCLLMAFKVLYPQNVFLLRGNHEEAGINKVYGFFDECKRKYSVKLWKCFTDVFNCLPVAACIDDRILCMHGGLSPDLQSFDQIRAVRRPLTVPESGLVCDLLWSDPEPHLRGWAESERGVSFMFGEDVVKSMCDRLSIDLVCRAHQIVEDGYQFFADRTLVTVFSAPNYAGEFDNAGAVMMVDETLMCSFKVLKPSTKRPRLQY